jgi:hypothetical protein
VARHRHCLPATCVSAESSLSGAARVGNTSHQRTGNRAVHPVRPMVLAISSPRSGVRG